MTLYTMLIDTPLGPLSAYASDAGLRALLFDPADAPRHGVKGEIGQSKDHPMLTSLSKQLAEYFAKERRDFDLPLDPIGTDFQRLAWKALLTIPYGEMRSYGEQARAIGKPTAVRAVGAANGRNPLGIIVPCHRVIGASGKLTGYAGGLDRKRALLEHEGAIAPLLL